jgi:hypothetical protein
MILGIVMIAMLTPHVFLNTAVAVPVMGGGLNPKHCENCHHYSQADSVVEVNERLRRLAASPSLFSMWSQ